MNPNEKPKENIDSEKERIINALKQKGVIDIEVRKEIIEWTKQREEQVVTSRDAIILNMERVDFYLATGDINGATECLDDAWTQANKEGEEDLKMKIEERLRNLKLN